MSTLARTALAALLLSGCIPIRPEVVGRTTAGRVIVQMPLRWSNSFLIEGERPILVDAGSAGDEERLERMLATRGVAIEDLAAVVITHGHADHAGLGATLTRRVEGPVILGARDVELAAAGHNHELRAMGLMAELIRPLIPQTYEPFTPDVTVSDHYDLRPLGLDADVIAMPGHTPGSVAIVLDGGIAFVGDQLRGGELGGALHPEVAMEHYYHDDQPANLRNIHAMLGRQIETFYVGHGGPVRRAAVIETFDERDSLLSAVLGPFWAQVLGGTQPPNWRSSSMATAMLR